MYHLKGFVDIKQLASNAAFEIAPIGELSSHSITYAKDRGIYNSINNKSLSIISFYSVSMINGVTEIPQPILSKALEIIEWVYNTQSSYSTVQSKQDFLLSYMTEFDSTCTVLSSGEIVNDITGHPYPEWITFSFRGYTTESNLVKLWFSDNSFRRQYDMSELVVIPPISNIDQFFQSAIKVRAALAAVSYTSIIDRISQARSESPETLLVAETFNWVNPNNVSDKIPTNWTVLIYGAMGNDSDLIKNAIVDYILSHSADEWKVIFPDLFKRTEFLIFPRWHYYAVENMTLQAGIYSPIINAKRELDYVKRILSVYPADFIDRHLTITVNPYRCLALDIIGSTENRDSLYEITDVYPDIMSISNTSNDFNRMDLKTQGFLDLLSKLILLAETMTAYSDIPIGVRRTLRNGILYATSTYENIQFMVSSKETTPLPV